MSSAGQFRLILVVLLVWRVSSFFTHLTVSSPIGSPAAHWGSSRNHDGLSRSYNTGDGCSKCEAYLTRGTGKRRTMAVMMGIRGPVRYSSSDWWNCLITLPTSRILKRVKLQILAVVAWSVLVQGAATVLKPGPAAVAKLSGLPVASLGAAVSLLLVFRNNASYDRFWEGRKLWSQVLATCRDLARLLTMHASHTTHQRLGRLIILLPIVLKQHLQGERVNKELRYLLPEDELVKLQGMKNRPCMVLKMLGEESYKAMMLHAEEQGYSGFQRVHLATLHDSHVSHHLSSLGQMIASCERLVKQPVPLSYSRHSSRFLSLFLFSLPFTMIRDLGWLTCPCMACVSWGYLCLHEISHFIEEPFNKKLQLIPLSSLIAYTRMEITDIMATPDGPQIFPPEMEVVENEIISKVLEYSRHGRNDDFLLYY